MNINFYDDPLQSPNSREDVKLKALGLFVHEGGRRVAVGFELTPFLERPSVEIQVTNERGEWAGSLTVIETMTPNFTLTMHLRDAEPTQLYHVAARVYYSHPEEEEKMVVSTHQANFDASQPGEHIIQFE